MITTYYCCGRSSARYSPRTLTTTTLIKSLEISFGSACVNERGNFCGTEWIPSVLESI